MLNKKRLLKLMRNLIAINSENPPGNEAKIANFVKDYLSKLGVKVRIYEFAKGRPNVIAYLGEERDKHSLLITPHLDTVPAGKSWSMDPFSGRIKGNKLYGLGATDCKVNLACAIEAINSIIEERIDLHYNLIFAATADEESGSELGLIPLLEKNILKPNAAVVLDADDFEIIVTQKGLMHLKVKLKGKKAHGAYPERGVNAIDMALKIIKGIKAKKFSYTKNKYLKAPTINVGTIKGGDKVNVVADWAEVELDFRFLPGMRAGDLIKALKEIIKEEAGKFSINGKIAGVNGKIEIDGIQQPYSLIEGHPLVTNLKNAFEKCSIQPRLKGSEGATVITFFQKKKIPAVATGFGSSACAHAADEYVKISNLYKGARVLEEFLRSYHAPCTLHHALLT